MAERQVISEEKVQRRVRIVHTCGHSEVLYEQWADDAEKKVCLDCSRREYNARMQRAQERYDAWVSSLSEQERRDELERADAGDEERHKYDNRY